MKMKSDSISSAIDGMISVGMNINKDDATNAIFSIYDKKGYEHQEVLNEFIINSTGSINYKFLAAGIVEYKKAREESLHLFPDVIPTLIKLKELGLKLGIVSDAPSREAWIRMYILKIHKILKNVCAVSTNVYNLILYIPRDNFISHILQNIWFLLLSLNQHIFSEYNKLLIDYYS